MRTALRTAVATALFAGLAVTPALAGTAFAADGPATTAGTAAPTAPKTDAPKKDEPKKDEPKKDDQKPAPKGGTVLSGPTVDGCTVTETIASVFPDWTVTLTNDAERGPKAVVKDEHGKVVATADRVHPADIGNGIKIKDVDTATAVFGQHTNGGDTAPYLWTGFPKLPKGCLTPSTPEPDGGTVLSGPTVHGCTVTEVIASSYGGGWTVTLTNDAKKGPKAVLKDEHGKVLETVDRAHPGPTGLGQKIVRAGTLTARYGQHTNGGDTAPYLWTGFPKLPKSCVSKPTTPTTPATTAPTTHGGQTGVVPKGGVAAGAEFGSVEQSNDTALLASAAGAVVVVAGLGFTALRRRATTRG
ncbi:hypothetical protein ACIRSU_24570 [Streptomyces sp. NPDC101160]|uniref:hypothetical protein n=1 Tax=Streptomyces sp. NPDC101160 TaxID=3366118 RepID=UPI0038129AA8